MAACHRPWLASRRLHGYAHKQMLKKCYADILRSSSGSEPPAWATHPIRCIDISNIILIEMHEHDTDFGRVVQSQATKQTNQARCRAMVTSVVADSSARLDMVCIHGSSGPLAAGMCATRPARSSSLG